jgi:predicted ferric reductase
MAEIIMKPAGRGIKYLPGQFVFVEFEVSGMAGEQHPFSITTAGKDELGIAVKNLGDFTQKMINLESGTRVWIEGPYGRFAQKFVKGRKQVWIGGGIGITPFMGMARGLTSGELKKLDVYYVVSERKEAVLVPEGVKTQIWVSREKGRITGKAIAKEIKDIRERKIMLCGPKPMMESLKRQLRELGVKSKNIMYERLSEGS